MHQTELSTAVVAEKIVAPKNVVIIGAATGGPAALANIIPKLPGSFPASILVLQQMRPGFTKLLASHLNTTSTALVEEAEDHQTLRPSQTLMAPGGYGMTIVRTEIPDRPFVVTLEDQSDSVAKSRARIDTVMKSAAEIFGSRTIGVILTGAGADGRDGLKAIRDAGGTTIAQDQDSCLLFDMPRAAIDARVVDEVVPLWNIADRLLELLGDD